MKRICFCLLAVVSCMLVGDTWSGEKTAEPVDKEFIKKIAGGHQAEIDIGKLAQKQANSAEVKDYANMLVKDHQDAMTKLAALLKTRTFGIVAGLEPETKEKLVRLGKLEGTEFDRAFVDDMVQDHKKAIKMVEGQIKNGKEADVSDYAKDILPKLRVHLQRGEELAATLKK